MEDEKEILRMWHEATEGCTKLNDVTKYTHTKQPVTTSQTFIEIDYLYDAPILTPDERIDYYAPNTSSKLINQLKAGKLCIIKTLDFHKKTTQETHQQLTQLLNNTPTNDHRCILCIHGKGNEKTPSILKGYLAHFLRLHPLCRACCSTLQRHGGTGSIYVLI